MANLQYDITKYQPVLFAADSMTHLVDTVGGIFASLDDETAERLRPAASRERAAAMK